MKKILLLSSSLFLFALSHAAITMTDTISNACNGTTTGSISLGASGGTAPYTYKISGGNYQSSNTFTGLTLGAHTFYAKDNLGMIDSLSAVIASSSQINITGVIDTAHKRINTTVTGGATPYNYYWPGVYNTINNPPYPLIDSPSIVITEGSTNLWQGDYLEIVTDRNGCTAIDSFIYPSLPGDTFHFITVIHSSNCYAAGSVDSLIFIPVPYFSAHSGYYSMSYNTSYPTGWFGTGSESYGGIITGPGLASASYEGYTGTYTSYYRYSEPTPLLLSQTVTNTTGGLSNGAITLTPSGGQTPYTYRWSGSSVTTSSRTGLAAGSYSVTVTERGGCSVTATYNVAGPIIMSGVATPALCYGSPSGTATLSATNGLPPYQYSSNGGINFQSSNVFSGLAAGSYIFTAKDASGQIDTLHLSVPQPVAVTVSGMVTNTIGGLNNGSIALTVSGGQRPYSYQWVPGSQTTATITGLAAGTYESIVRDSNSCTVIDTFRVLAGTLNPLTLYMDTVAGSGGQTTVVHVKVKNFKKIVSAQGTIQFNTPVITYSGVQQFGTSSLNASDFGTTTISNGTLSFAWSDPTLAGVTLADGTVLFAVQYNVVGAAGQSSPTTFVSSPTQLEFADTSFNTIPYIVYPGLVTVNSSITISGRIHEWTVNDGVRKTNVSLTGSTHSSVLTDTSGRYSFTLSGGTADTITPAKNNDSIRTNGVTTLDVLMVQRYILGTYSLTGPYRLIAADVNSSGSITSLDATLMQALILGNITTFTGNKLWAFVPTSYTFTNPQSPWGFPTSRYYSNAVTASGQDFTGIKLGDVNGDWSPLAGKTQTNNDSLQLYITKDTVHQGQTVAVAIKARGFKGISGMQFTLDWDSTQLFYLGVDTIGSNLLVNVGTSQASSGILGVVWTDPNSAYTNVPDDSTLFHVYFDVIGAPGDSTSLRFDSVPTAIQFIDSNLNILNASLESGEVYVTFPAGIDQTNPDQISVYPNPARSEVVVNISKPQMGTTMVATDVSGQVVCTKDISGQQSVSISVSDWAEGIYILQVKYADKVKTLKLAVIHP